MIFHFGIRMKDIRTNLLFQINIAFLTWLPHVFSSWFFKSSSFIFISFSFCWATSLDNSKSIAISLFWCWLRSHWHYILSCIQYLPLLCHSLLSLQIFWCYGDNRDLRSFQTRRSSDILDILHKLTSLSVSLCCLLSYKLISFLVERKTKQNSA